MDIVDENNRVIDQASRKEVRAKNLLHRSTYIFVFNSAGDLFVQKRTATKDIYPGRYDVTGGGVVLAGETYEEGAKRELAEELGIEGAELKRLFEFFYADDDNRTMGVAFSCVYDGEMVLQREEIVEGNFLPISEVLRLSQREEFCPDGLAALRQYLQGGAG